MKYYLVGGAVRDELLGKKTNDFDYVVVGASYEYLLQLFGEPVGEDFPVFLHKETGDQYAMARKERKIGVGYHGFECEFGENVTLEDDLSRRDLTINAIAKDTETGELADPFGGIDDLKNKVLRHVSDAFAEDPLRVVRLARFAARYDEFSIAAETMALAQKVVDSGEMDDLPYERYWLEIEKMLMDGNPIKFFSIIKQLDGFNKIKFFKDVWGPGGMTSDYPWITRIGKVVHYIKEDQRLKFFVALTAENLDNVHGTTVRMVELFKQLVKVEDGVNRPVDWLYNFLQTSKAWSQSDLSDDVASALGIYEVADIWVPLRSYAFRELTKKCSAVTAEPYMHLQGKAIGEAMASERKRIIKEWIGD